MGGIRKDLVRELEGKKNMGNLGVDAKKYSNKS
jgi:hypothetical protein